MKFDSDKVTKLLVLLLQKITGFQKTHYKMVKIVLHVFFKKNKQFNVNDFFKFLNILKTQ